MPDSVPPPHNVIPSYKHFIDGRVPDDSHVETRLPSICVDYLSHEWTEDDVWTSWKAMTRHKYEIANGVRLENASWRTWAKQRSKLKTISPETLNWLKDSDVTWLYGPLHTAVDPVPPAKLATASDRLGLDTPSTPTIRESRSMIAQSSATRATSHPRKSGMQPSSCRPRPKKSILKHRSISDILGLPSPSCSVEDSTAESSGFSTTNSSSSELSSFDHEEDDVDSKEAVQRLVKRARLGHSASDTNVPRKSSIRRPPNVRTNSHEGHFPPAVEKRHISFNHRVDQCISVDIVDEDEIKIKPRSKLRSQFQDTSDTSDDDADEILTIRSSPRTPGHNISFFSPATTPTNSETHTIVKLAPTTLKSIEIFPAPSPIVVYQDEDGNIVGYGSSPIGTSITPPNDALKKDLPALQDMPATSWEGPYDTGFSYYDGPDQSFMEDSYDAAQMHRSHWKGYNRQMSPESVKTPYVPTPTSEDYLSAVGASYRTVASSFSPESSQPSTPSGSTSPIPDIVTHGRSPSPIDASSPIMLRGRGDDHEYEPRGRSISRGSSSSSLDRVAASDNRRIPSSSISPQYGYSASPPTARWGSRSRGTSSPSLVHSRSSSTSSINSAAQSRALPSIDEAQHLEQALSPGGRSHKLPEDLDLDSPELPVAPSGKNSSWNFGPQRPSKPKENPSTPRRVSPTSSVQTHAASRKSPPSYPAARSRSRDSQHSIDLDSDDPAGLFDSPSLPSSPVFGNPNSFQTPSASSSYNSLHTLRWSDEPESAAQKALLKAAERADIGISKKRNSTSSIITRPFDGHRRESTDTTRSINMNDDYGFGDESPGGVVKQAVEAVGTARDLIGALWNVGTSVLWRRRDSGST